MGLKNLDLFKGLRNLSYSKVWEIWILHRFDIELDRLEGLSITSPNVVALCISIGKERKIRVVLIYIFFSYFLIPRNLISRNHFKIQASVITSFSGWVLYRNFTSKWSNINGALHWLCTRYSASLHLDFLLIRYKNIEGIYFLQVSNF